LHNALKEITVNFIQKKGQDNRSRKTKQQTVHVDKQRITQEPSEVETGKKLPEIPHTYPLTVPYTHSGPVILKSYNDPAHGGITKNEIPGKAEQGDYIYRTVYLYIPANTVSKRIFTGYTGQRRREGFFTKKHSLHALFTPLYYYC
jgi:hypothetical protein